MVEQEATPVFKEQFVPPDLSIWDYFIRKVTRNISDSKMCRVPYQRDLNLLLCSLHRCLCVLQPLLPPSENRIEYDSEESQSSQDEEEEEDDDEYEDAFDPNAPQREHSNHNSYR